MATVRFRKPDPDDPKMQFGKLVINVPLGGPTPSVKNEPDELAIPSEDEIERVLNVAAEAGHQRLSIGQLLGYPEEGHPDYKHAGKFMDAVLEPYVVYRLSVSFQDSYAERHDFVELPSGAAFLCKWTNYDSDDVARMPDGWTEDDVLKRLVVNQDSFNGEYWLGCTTYLDIEMGWRGYMPREQIGELEYEQYYPVEDPDFVRLLFGFPRTPGEDGWRTRDPESDESPDDDEA